MIKTIIDVLLSLLLGGLMALLFVLACPIGSEGESWLDAVTSRLKTGWRRLGRTEIRMVGIALAVASYILILPFPGLVLCGWTSYWMLVLYAPEVLEDLADKAKAKLFRRNKAKITAEVRKD